MFRGLVGVTGLGEAEREWGHIFRCHYFLDSIIYLCIMHLWPDPFEWTIPTRFTMCCPVEMKERKSSGMRKITSDFLRRLAEWSNDLNWKSMPTPSRRINFIYSSALKGPISHVRSSGWASAILSSLTEDISELGTWFKDVSRVFSYRMNATLRPCVFIFMGTR